MRLVVRLAVALEVWRWVAGQAEARAAVGEAVAVAGCYMPTIE